MPFRANNVSLRQPSDGLLRNLYELMGHHILGAVEAETIDGGLGMGFTQRKHGISIVIFTTKKIFFIFFLLFCPQVENDEEPRPEFETSVKTYRINPVTREKEAFMPYW